jgi:hypothetical protein
MNQVFRWREREGSSAAALLCGCTGVGQWLIFDRAGRHLRQPGWAARSKEAIMPSILITGANRGLGLEFSRQYAAEGWSVLATCRHPEAASALEDLRTVGDITAIVLDVTDEASIAAAVASTTERLGPIDVLVNNAGVYPAPPTAQTDDETFDRIIAVNVRAPFYLVAQLAPSMAERGGGTIVNIGSWVSTGHCCIEPKGVLATAQNSDAGSTIPVENHDKPGIRARPWGFWACR